MSSETKQPPRLSHARDLSRPGFYVKLVLMMLVNAFGLYGVMASYGQQEWGVLAFLAVTLLVVDYIYFSKRAIPAKYLVPGLIFLFVFQIYVMLNTAYVAFTNYGDGHNDAKGPAITQIMKTSDRRVEGTPTFPVAVLDKDGQVAFAVVDDGVARVGTAEEPLADAPDATVDGTRLTAAPGAAVLTLP
ncbi:MAG TPA: maltose ABC transporter permease, partial [Arachnia sp.]|nr:maltose ABC transporter permease [Arachnia sp.]